MERLITFTKASGAGNDFVIVDKSRGDLRGEPSRLAAALCSRHFGIGADGLLLIEPSSRADFTMRYFNADGSFGGMCGNGGRCAARYAALRGIAGMTMTFEALDFVYRAEVRGPSVRLAMKDPTRVRAHLRIATAREETAASFIDTGAPHLVIFDPALDDRDVVSTGRLLAHHAEFGTEGTNVDFVQLLGADRIAMRTYERGVEDETLACGTGSVASALIASLQFGLRSPVHVLTRGGEDLHVEFRNEEGTPRDIVLAGRAQMLFSGTVRYDDAKGHILEPTIDTPTTHRSHP